MICVIFAQDSGLKSDRISSGVKESGYWGNYATSLCLGKFVNAVFAKVPNNRVIYALLKHLTASRTSMKS